MEPDFWHARWRDGQIGFHLERVNPQLLRHHAVLGPAAGSRVWVPLCGKSVDLVWLAEQGHEVVGVELSPIAVQAFFAEHALSPVVDTWGPFTRHRAGRIEILCGDVFATSAAWLGRVTALFDRAALVALPAALRPRYARLIAELLPTGAHGLLATFDYEPSAEAGPPFSVNDAEVKALYGTAFELSLLERADILEAEPRFKARGMTALHESAYRLLRRATTI